MKWFALHPKRPGQVLEMHADLNLVGPISFESVDREVEQDGMRSVPLICAARSSASGRMTRCFGRSCGFGKFTQIEDLVTADRRVLARATAKKAEVAVGNLNTACTGVMRVRRS
jgi:hypothetical protein